MCSNNKKCTSCSCHSEEEPLPDTLELVNTMVFIEHRIDQLESNVHVITQQLTDAKKHEF